MSHTQSSLSSFRRCARLHRLRYGLKLSLDGDGEREVLAVGSCWHEMHRVGRDPYFVARSHAPTVLWAEKLGRLYAAHRWYWQKYDAGSKLVTTATEQTFRVKLGSREFEGQIDERVVTPDGRRGIIERKTTSESLEPGSGYWQRLRLDVQVGLYGLAAGRPDFILYDVVRKPTIEPKSISKKELARMASELRHPDPKMGPGATYYGERFQQEAIEPALEREHETELLYGARLTADIGDRPDHYFARREVPRTFADYDELERDILDQVELIDLANRVDLANRGGLWPRNPDACHAFGACEFFRLCSNNVNVTAEHVPPGYVRREHLHPELAQANETSTRKELTT